MAPSRVTVVLRKLKVMTVEQSVVESVAG